MPVLSLETVTLALGTTDPEASTTVPEIPARPPTDCAKQYAEASKNTSTLDKKRTNTSLKDLDRNRPGFLLFETEAQSIASESFSAIKNRCEIDSGPGQYFWEKCLQPVDRQIDKRAEGNAGGTLGKGRLGIVKPCGARDID